MNLGTMLAANSLLLSYAALTSFQDGKSFSVRVFSPHDSPTYLKREAAGAGQHQGLDTQENVEFVLDC
ncbi:MAG: hypothetical protein ACOYEU_10440 [Limnochordia bacterium]